MTLAVFLYEVQTHIHPMIELRCEQLLQGQPPKPRYSYCSASIMPCKCFIYFHIYRDGRDIRREMAIQAGLQQIRDTAGREFYVEG